MISFAVFGPAATTPAAQEWMDRIIAAMESPTCLYLLGTDEPAKQMLNSYDFVALFTLDENSETLHSYDGRRYHLHPKLMAQRILVFDMMRRSTLTILLGTPPKETLHAINQALRRLNKPIVNAEQNIEQLEDVIAMLTREA